MRLIDADILIEEAKNLHVDDFMIIKAMADKQPTVKDVCGREYVSKYGSCPMCTDCPDGCPLDGRSDNG